MELLKGIQFDCLLLDMFDLGFCLVDNTTLRRYPLPNGSVDGRIPEGQLSLAGRIKQFIMFLKGSLDYLTGKPFSPKSNGLKLK